MLANLKAKFNAKRQAAKNKSHSRGSSTSAPATTAPTKKDEPTFNILPHPAKHNHPPHEPPQPGQGLNSSPEWNAHQVPGPFVPDRPMANALENPIPREQLHARAEELNRA